jgi:transglutaminase-like putative cysteine protease
MEKRNFLLLIFLAMLLSSAPHATSSEEIFHASTILLDVDLESSFSLQGGQGSDADYANAKMFFYPEDDDQQQVLSSRVSPEAEIKDDYINFYWPNPYLQSYKYGISSRIRTTNTFSDIDRKIRFPLDGVPKNIEPYLQSTEKADVTDKIIKTASGIAEGEDDLSVVVFKLASWVNQNIDYNITTKTADASQKASWVLENRYGVCDEMTNLFIAMCRSLGIPARFVSGISYTNAEIFSSEWGLHGWAEVYFPGIGWVPFDPTYGQYGYIDAGHIKLKDSFDSDKSSTKFEWRGNGVDLVPGDLEVDVAVIEIGEQRISGLQAEIAAFSPEVSYGSHNYILATFKNPTGHYIFFETTLSSTKEITKITGNQHVVLSPGEEQTLYWIVKVSDTLDKNYVYTFPFSVSTSLGDLHKDSFKAQARSPKYSLAQLQDLIDRLTDIGEKNYVGKVSVDCTTPPLAYVNETFNVDCAIKNSGNTMLAGLRACIGVICEKSDLGISQSANLTLKTRLSDPGLQNIVLTVRNADASAVQTFQVLAEDLPRLSVQNLETPDILLFDQDFQVKFDVVKESGSSPRDAEIILMFNGKKSAWSFEKIDATEKFSVALDSGFMNNANNSATVHVTYKDSFGRDYNASLRRDIPIEDLNGWQKFVVWLGEVARSLESFLGL